MTKNLISISLIILFISACAKPTYEDATKWYSECHPHPGYHPGDLYAYEPGIDETLCTEECAVTFKCHNALPSDSSIAAKIKKSCTESLHSCKFGCFEKGHPIGVIAEHVEGGYYSDGSYFAQCYYFENIHPTKDKYKKTKWQNDRDECIDITFENIKPQFVEGQKGGFGFINRAKKYYRSCLNKRGYRG